MGFTIQPTIYSLGKQMGAEDLLATATSRISPEAAQLAEKGAAMAVQLLDDARENIVARRLSKSKVFSWAPDAIARHLDMPMSDLNTPGFKILDVGAGVQAIAKMVNSQNWASQVYSVEPRLAISQATENAYTKYPFNLADLRPVHPLTVAAVADQLPFASSSFDRVVSHFSTPYYMDDPLEIKGALAEMMRVVRHEGIARVFPITRRHVEMVEELMPSLGKKFELQKMGTVITHPYGSEYAWRLVTMPSSRLISKFRSLFTG